MMLLLHLAQDIHPCKKEYNSTTAKPDCLRDEYGTCEVYEHALFCPKYGLPVGAIDKYGSDMIEVVEQ